MHMSDSFVRIPTRLLDALLNARLSQTQGLILLWVIRQTYGWNRPQTTFTWYRVAQELGLDRPTVYRSGKALAQARLLIVEGEHVSVQVDSTRWDSLLMRGESVGARQLDMPAPTVGQEQLKALAGVNAIDGGKQRKRRRGPTVFRPPKDSSKDRLKTYRQGRKDNSAPIDRNDGPGKTERQPLAANSIPVRNKYERLSQN